MSSQRHATRRNSAGSGWHWPLDASTRTHTGPKHARRRAFLAPRLINSAALLLTGVLTLFAVATGTAAAQLTNNVASVDLDLVMIDERPTVAVPLTPRAPQPLNILVLGIDGRFDDNAEFATDEVEGARADSTIVMHISSDRESVTMVSIPRDSIVDIPRCPTSTVGLTVPAQPATRFNAAFAGGYDTGGDVESGALCTLATVEQETNIRMDGFIVMDFAGFKNMVDALGGVDMDIPNRIDAPLADGLVLEAGFQTLDGWQALQYARARTGQGLGDGSDLQRITRQQKLLGAMADKVMETNLLTSGPQLLRFLNATTQSMTASSNFATVGGLSSLAMSLNNIDVENIDFKMVPIILNPENKNTVIWTAEADELWNAIRYDQLGRESSKVTPAIIEAEG
ncbi:MAG: LCP family protein [Promicromonosporaceae bacterium]|nr:LCP family protein [Promicromonosporaceae bacterium]